jgi:thymidylate synthase ThyX
MTISAKIILDSISQSNKRITTFVLKYPRYIHAEVMTHRLFSRNSASSRAIPYQKLKENIINDPVMPTYYGKNRPGMQAYESLDSFNTERVKYLISQVLRETIGLTDQMYEAGLHKQNINRYLEPFMHMEIVCTATEWDNFYSLRNHPDAQPEIQELARAMLVAHNESVPTQLSTGHWHLPFIKEGELELHGEELCKKISVARCGRVSYLNHEGKATTVEEDLKLYKKMIESKPMHASAAEHQAMAMLNPEYRCGNFVGWIQYRKTLDNEYNSSYEGLLAK